MSRLQDFMSKIVSFWVGIKTDGKFVGTAIRDWVVDGYTRLFVGVMEGLETGFSEILSKVIKTAEDTGKVPDALKDITDELKKPTHPALAFLGMTAGGAAGGGLISSTIGPWLLLLQYEIQRAANQYRLPLGSIVEAYRRGWPLGYDWSTDYRDQGITDERFNTVVEISKVLVDVQHLITLRVRKEIEPADYITRMAKLGYDETEAEDYYKALEFYPTPDDLVRWQAKEVFEPDMISRYGLDAELGEVNRDAFYKAHMTDEQIANYWRAHWEHASWGQVTDMLHRGLLTTTGAAPDIPTTPDAWRSRDSQGEAALYDYYRLVEIPPFWRDLLTRISFRPLTRVDIRRMHKLGVLDRNALYSAYRTHGYNDANAELMTVWTEKYNQGTATAADRDLTKSDILRMYRDRLLSQVDAHDMLIDLGYNEDEAGYLLDLASQGTAAKTRDLTLSQVKSLYQLGLRSKTQVTVFLEAFGYNADEILALYELWDWEKPAPTRIPSRTDFDKFIAADIISLGAWSEGYTALGYDMKYQEWYFALLVSKGLEYQGG